MPELNYCPLWHPPSHLSFAVLWAWCKLVLALTLTKQSELYAFKRYKVKSSLNSANYTLKFLYSITTTLFYNLQHVFFFIKQNNVPCYTLNTKCIPLLSSRPAVDSVSISLCRLRWRELEVRWQSSGITVHFKLAPSKFPLTCWQNRLVSSQDVLRHDPPPHSRCATATRCRTRSARSCACSAHRGSARRWGGGRRASCMRPRRATGYVRRVVVLFIDIVQSFTVT